MKIDSQVEINFYKELQYYAYTKHMSSRYSMQEAQTLLKSMEKPGNQVEIHEYIPQFFILKANKRRGKVKIIFKGKEDLKELKIYISEYSQDPSPVNNTWYFQGPRSITLNPLDLRKNIKETPKGITKMGAVFCFQNIYFRMESPKQIQFYCEVTFPEEDDY